MGKYLNISSPNCYNPLNRLHLSYRNSVKVKHLVFFISQSRAKATTSIAHAGHAKKVSKAIAWREIKLDICMFCKQSDSLCAVFPFLEKYCTSKTTIVPLRFYHPAYRLWLKKRSAGVVLLTIGGATCLTHRDTSTHTPRAGDLHGARHSHYKTTVWNAPERRFTGKKCSAAALMSIFPCAFLLFRLAAIPTLSSELSCHVCYWNLLSRCNNNDLIFW
jgi:hypothetical protein